MSQKKAKELRSKLEAGEIVGGAAWALNRVGELRAKGEEARFRITWHLSRGRTIYEVTVRRADGSIEREPRF